MDNYLGINALNHESSVSIVRSDGEILFSSASERYSKVKNDSLLDESLMNYILEKYSPNKVFWYENPIKTNIRKYITGENINQSPSKYLKKFTKLEPIYSDHHLAHAASGFSTSKFNNACVLVIDGVGQFTTTSIWYASFDGKKCKYKLLKKYYYPNSLGLFYSFFTQRVGFKPNEEEYIMMGLSSFGNDCLVSDMKKKFINLRENGDYKLKKYLHISDSDCFKDSDLSDISFAAQRVFEESLENILKNITKFSKNLVYVGGCALNCLANRILPNYFENIWIMPNPGDGGLSIGAISSNIKIKLNWTTPYLGHEVCGDYPIKDLINLLLSEGIVGVCNGRAEFGPRSLGNRSLLADPRILNMKDRVNEIKRRQNFRPFSASIKMERYTDYFDDIVPESPYMQYAVPFKYPKKYPSICHIDGTCRVQTVSKENNFGFWSLLDAWESKTGCPFLLNTSLNIKGMPIVNDINDAKNFEIKYGVKVIS